ncbi:MAG: ribonuclease HII [Candidatus Paceibacterota bacterium]
MNRKSKISTKWLLGVDEAGRGPLAGPVAVGVVLVKPDFDWKTIPGVGDSKKVTPKKSNPNFRRAKENKKEGKLDFQVALSSHLIIDDKGIVFAINKAMKRALTKLTLNPDECEIRLDGALRAPSSFTNQQTIIKGDSKELCIGLASILAKVTRDQHMKRLSTKYPLYNFDIHKGYGTKDHRVRITKHGLSDIHRRTFCRNIHN